MKTNLISRMLAVTMMSASFASLGASVGFAASAISNRGDINKLSEDFETEFLKSKDSIFEAGSQILTADETYFANLIYDSMSKQTKMEIENILQDSNDAYIVEQLKEVYKSILEETFENSQQASFCPSFKKNDGTIVNASNIWTESTLEKCKNMIDAMQEDDLCDFALLRSIKSYHRDAKQNAINNLFITISTLLATLLLFVSSKTLDNKIMSTVDTRAEIEIKA